MKELTEKNYLAEYGYLKSDIIVQWPLSQNLMEKSWFDECELIIDLVGLEIFGPTAYVVPAERYNSTKF